jgi:hypothetical protein
MVLCQSASDSLIFICTTAGTTAIQEPTAYATVTDGNTVIDGTAVFKAVSVSGQITKLSKTEVLISNSGDAYDSTKAYAVGDLCIHNDTLQRCITPCSAGSWATNQSCFTQDTLVNALATKMKMVELWSNSNPTADFSADTIALQTNTCDLYLVVTANGTCLLNRIVGQRSVVTYFGSISSVMYQIQRTFYLNNLSHNSLVIENCYKASFVDGTRTTQNDSIVPLKVYGLI